MFYIEYVLLLYVVCIMGFVDVNRQWHATTSQADDKFTQDLLNSKLGGKPLDKIDVKDFAIAFGGALKAILAIPPKDRTIGK